MSILEYNIRYIILMIFVLGILCMIYPCITACIKDKNSKVYKIGNKYFLLLTILLILLTLICMPSGIAKKDDKTEEMTIEKIIYHEEFFIFREYQLYCLDNNGNSLIMEVPFFASNKFKKQVTNILIGDIIMITYSDGWKLPLNQTKFIYDYQFIEWKYAK